MSARSGLPELDYWLAPRWSRGSAAAVRSPMARNSRSQISRSQLPFLPAAAIRVPERLTDRPQPGQVLDQSRRGEDARDVDLLDLDALPSGLGEDLPDPTLVGEGELARGPRPPLGQRRQLPPNGEPPFLGAGCSVRTGNTRQRR